MEVHIFVINPAEFRHQRKTGRGQGRRITVRRSTISCWMNSIAPISGWRAHIPWWIIPPNLEHRFNDVARELVQKRFIRGRLSGFWGLPEYSPPANMGRACGSSIWVLMHRTNRCSNFMLIETYAADPGAGPNLSLSFNRPS